MDSRFKGKERATLGIHQQDIKRIQDLPQGKASSMAFVRKKGFGVPYGFRPDLYNRFTATAAQDWCTVIGIGNRNQNWGITTVYICR